MELKITASRAGRLSSFLQGELKMSTGLTNRLKRTEAITVNGIHRWMNYQVLPGDVIAVDLQEEVPDYPAEAGDLAILYEDDFLLAVDKPAGMLIHPSRSRITGTLANLVAGYYQKTGQKSAFHPMTRLDRDTFGIVLLAKSAHVHALLQQTESRKFYHALVWGGPEGAEGIIDAPIARREIPSLLRYIHESGKPSQTAWKVLERQEGYAKLELEAITGRTHQLRLHCAHMGFPILGDPQYGSEESQAFSLERGLTHQRLCAKRLEIIHPITGERLILEARTDVTV